MNSAIYSGSFDPITRGHEDIIKRASTLTDKLYVAVLDNVNKKYLFTLEERTQMVKDAFFSYKNIEVVTFSGLLIDYMKSKNISLIIRGLRSVADYEYELTMALANRELSEGKVESLFMHSEKKYMYLSSTVVREIAANGGKLSDYLSKEVESRVKNKYNGEK